LIGPGSCRTFRKRSECLVQARNSIENAIMLWHGGKTEEARSHPIISGRFHKEKRSRQPPGSGSLLQSSWISNYRPAYPGTEQVLVHLESSTRRGWWHRSTTVGTQDRFTMHGDGWWPQVLAHPGNRLGIFNLLRSMGLKSVVSQRTCETWDAVLREIRAQNRSSLKFPRSFGGCCHRSVNACSA
jgi:hypothetical protein